MTASPIFLLLPAAMAMPEVLRAEVKDYSRRPRWVPTEKFYPALVFAVGLHANKSRKNAQRDPYLTHLLAVASLVVEDNGSEDDAIAALLHDAAEDRPLGENAPEGGIRRLEQIRSDFGENVARLVRGCSEDLDGREETPWDIRKRRYVERLRGEPADVRRISLADKLHNARCLAADLEAGDGVGERFNADADHQRWYYGELLKSFEQSGTESRHLPEFRRLVVRLSAALQPDATAAQPGQPTGTVTG